MSKVHQTEQEVFGDASPLWTKHKCYKIYSKRFGKPPAPPAVWIAAQTLMLIDKGLLIGIERKEAEEALKVLGWICKKNEKGQTVLHPDV